MASWERLSYASPGDLVHWPVRTVLTRPFFYESHGLIDDLVDISPNRPVLVIGVFPEGRNKRNPARGAIVMVPKQGLWWWSWYP